MSSTSDTSSNLEVRDSHIKGVVNIMPSEESKSALLKSSYSEEYVPSLIDKPLIQEAVWLTAIQNYFSLENIIL